MRLAPRARRLTCAVLVFLFAATFPTMSAAQTSFPGACRDIDPMDADAYGKGVTLSVRMNGEDVFVTDPPAAEAYQDGPGKSGDKMGAVDINVPDEEDPIVSAQLLRSRVDLDVDEDPLEAEAWVNTRLAHLNVLDGLVTADVVRGFAYARADVRSARTYTDPSTIVNLKVQGVSVTDISPGTNITLPELAFGAGSYVSVYERIDNSKFPTSDEPLYKADVTVRMINVHITDMVLLGSIDVIVSESRAYAQAPTPWCGLAQSVEAGAYILRSRPLIEEPGILVGEQHIAITGGSARQQLLGQHLSVGPLEVLLNVTETDAYGEVVVEEYSEATAFGQVTGLCIKLDSDECFVKLTLVRADVHCRADEDGADCTGEVTIVGLVVDGVDVCKALNLNGTCKPPASTTHSIGPIKVILNQQERQEDDGYESLYVRAIRIEAPILGTLIVSRAYAAAAFEDVGSAKESTDPWDL